MCQVPTQEQACVGIKDSTQCSTMGCTLAPEECIRLDTQVGCCRWDCAGDCANVATNKCVPRTGPTDLCQMPTQAPCQSCSPSQIEEGCFFLPASAGGAAQCMPCALCPAGQERHGCTGDYAGDCVDCQAGTFALASDAYCRPCPQVRKCVRS